MIRHDLYPKIMYSPTEHSLEGNDGCKMLMERNDLLVKHSGSSHGKESISSGLSLQDRPEGLGGEGFGCQELCGRCHRGQGYTREERHPCYTHPQFHDQKAPPEG